MLRRFAYSGLRGEVAGGRNVRQRVRNFVERSTRVWKIENYGAFSPVVECFLSGMAVKLIPRADAESRISLSTALPLR